MSRGFSPTTWGWIFSGASERYRLTWSAAGLIVAFGAGLMLINLGSARVLTFHEVLFAQPAREMVATGNWSLPQFVGVPSTHKPPGTHWAIAAAMLLAGSRDEAVVRIPAVLATLVAALVVAAFAARWFGARIGLLAGLMHLTAYSTLQMARLAESDMPLTASVCGAMFCFAAANVDSPRGRSEARWMPWLFYFLIGASYLFKGLIGPAFIGTGCLAFVIWNRDRRAFQFLLSPIGWALMSTLAAGWFATACWQHPAFLDDQIMHHFGRFRGEMGGDKAPFFYAYSILLVTLPWAPWILFGIVRGFRRQRLRDPLWRFLACWFCPGMALLSASAFQSKHYTAPLLPPLILVGALALVEYVRFRQRVSGRGHLCAVVASVAGCGIGIAAVLAAQPKGASIIAGLILALAVGLVLMSYWEYRRRTAAEFTTLFATAWLLAVGVFSFVMPHHDSYRDQTEFAQRINRTVPEDETVYLVRIIENQIAFYLDRPLMRVDDPADAPAEMAAEEGTAFVLVPERDIEALSRMGRIEVLDRCDSVNRYMDIDERLTLVRIHRGTAAVSIAGAPLDRL